MKSYKICSLVFIICLVIGILDLGLTPKASALPNYWSSGQDPSEQTYRMFTIRDSFVPVTRLTIREEGTVEVGSSATPAKLLTWGNIEMNGTAGIKFPDGNTQTTAYMGGAGNLTTADADTRYVSKTAGGKVTGVLSTEGTTHLVSGGVGGVAIGTDFLPAGYKMYVTGNVRIGTSGVSIDATDGYYYGNGSRLSNTLTNGGKVTGILSTEGSTHLVTGGVGGVAIGTDTLPAGYKMYVTGNVRIGTAGVSVDATNGYYYGNGSKLTGISGGMSSAEVIANYVTKPNGRMTGLLTVEGSTSLVSGGVGGVAIGTDTMPAGAYKMYVTGDVKIGTAGVSVDATNGYYYGNGSKLSGLPTAMTTADADTKYVSKTAGGKVTGILTTEGSTHLATAGGKVGIGTSNPSYPLTMVASIASTAAQFGNIYSSTTPGQGSYGVDIYVNDHSSDKYGLEVRSSSNNDKNYDKTNLYVRNDGNVGIGTGSPTGKLDVLAGAARAGTQPTSPSFYVTGTMSSGIAGPAANDIEFRHDNGSQGIGFGYNTIYSTGYTTNQNLNLQSRGAGPITLNAYPSYSTGSVGIGTATPGTAKLAVMGGVGIGTTEIASDRQLDIYNPSSHAFAQIASGGSIINANSNACAQLYFKNAYNAAAGGTGYYIGLNSWDNNNFSIGNVNNPWTRFLSISTGGNVGIGDIRRDPHERLEVDGNLMIADTYDPINCHLTITPYLIGDRAGSRVGYSFVTKSFNGGLMQTFYPLTFDNVGKVFIGQGMDVAGSVYVGGGMQVAGLNYVSRGAYNNGVYVNPDGTFTLNSSDIRLKKNIVSISDQMDVLGSLKKLRGVYFNWNTSMEKVKNYGDQKEIGMIAQEVEPVIREAVGEGNDGYKFLGYEKLTPFLIEVCKAQQKEIEGQQEQLDEQKKINEELKARLDKLENRLQPAASN